MTITEDQDYLNLPPNLRYSSSSRVPKSRAPRIAMDSNMERSYLIPPDALELNQLIDKHHQGMLNAERPEEKAEILRQLRGYIAEYLYLVPHRSKFKLEETGKVLAQSVGAVYEFDPREAMVAFEDLAKYAHNLLEQPWRKEFHKLKMTSGFFIHNIRAHIQNPQDMLIVLGYASTDDYTLQLHRIAEEDILRAFSRDCYVASHECLILSQVWEKVQRQLPTYPLTVMEAWEIRKSFVGDVDHVCSTLLMETRTKLYEMEMEQRKILEQKEHEKFQEVMKSANMLPPPEVPEERLINLDEEDTSCHNKSNSSLNHLNLNDSCMTDDEDEDEIVKNVHRFTSAAEKKPVSSSSGSTFHNLPPSAFLYDKNRNPDYENAGHSQSQHMNGFATPTHNNALSPTKAKENEDKHEYAFSPLLEQQRRNEKELEEVVWKQVLESKQKDQERAERARQREQEAKLSKQQQRSPGANASSSSYFKSINKKQDLPRSASYEKEKKVSTAEKLKNVVMGNNKTAKRKENQSKNESDGAAEANDTSSSSNSRKIGFGLGNFPLSRTKVADPDLSTTTTTSPTNTINPNENKPGDWPKLTDKKITDNNSSSSSSSMKNESKRSYADAAIGNDIVDYSKFDYSTAIDGGEVDLDKWECKHCTYLNKQGDKICEMCAKSRFLASPP